MRQSQEQGGVRHGANHEGPVPALAFLRELGDRGVDDHAADHESHQVEQRAESGCPASAAAAQPAREAERQQDSAPRGSIGLTGSGCSGRSVIVKRCRPMATANRSQGQVRAFPGPHHRVRRGSRHRGRSRPCAARGATDACTAAVAPRAFPAAPVADRPPWSRGRRSRRKPDHGPQVDAVLREAAFWRCPGAVVSGAPGIAWRAGSTWTNV